MTDARRRRVFLHIGLPKTGTTYLQDAIWENRDALEQRGLFVPGIRRHHLLAALDFWDDPSLERRPRQVQHPWRYLVDQINDQPADALISHEFFCPATADHVPRAEQAFPDAEVHVVLTARGTVDLFVSRWQEWIKNGARRPIDEYPKERTDGRPSTWGWASIDLSMVLQAWGAVLPAERIHVVPMRADGQGGPEDLWRRFLDVLGVAPEGLAPARRGANQSLSLVEVELLRRVNRRLQGFSSPFDRGHWIRGHLAEGTMRGLAEREAFRPGEEKLRDLQEREERMLEMLDGGGYDLRGSPEQLRSADLSGRRHPSEVTAAELNALSTRVIARLLGDVRAASTQDRPGDPDDPDDGPGSAEESSRDGGR